MKDYELHLLLEALCNTCSREELTKSKGVSKVLSQYLRIPRWEARLLVAGALDMKLSRGHRGKDENRSLYEVH